jgi:hypothetical protein
VVSPKESTAGLKNNNKLRNKYMAYEWSNNG